jgi:hypothetical protein
VKEVFPPAGFFFFRFFDFEVALFVSDFALANSWLETAFDARTATSIMQMGITIAVRTRVNRANFCIYFSPY